MPNAIHIPMYVFISLTVTGSYLLWCFSAMFFFTLFCVTVSFICKRFKHLICKIKAKEVYSFRIISSSGMSGFSKSWSWSWWKWSKCFHIFLICPLNFIGFLEGFIDNFLEPALFFLSCLFLAFRCYQLDFHYYYNCFLALKHYKVPHWNQLCF